MLKADEAELTGLELNSLCSALPTELKERCERANAQSLKRDRILAYTALMYAIYEFGLDPDKINITHSELGKPKIEGSLINVSVSHSGGVGIAAISGDLDVGIDVELLSERTDSTLKRVSDRFIPDFDPKPYPLSECIFDGEAKGSGELEVKFFELIPKRNEGQAFLEKVEAACLAVTDSKRAEKWTCAEALAKLDGRGMSAFPEIEALSRSAKLFSAVTKPNGSISVMLSLAVK